MVASFPLLLRDGENFKVDLFFYFVSLLFSRMSSRLVPLPTDFSFPRAFYIERRAVLPLSFSPILKSDEIFLSVLFLLPLDASNPF